MGYTVRKIIDKDNADEWLPRVRGRWEVHDADGEIVYQFKWKLKGDNTEWPEREWWQGPMDVRISEDGKWVECYHQSGIKHGIAFEHTLGQRVERHPLPPTTAEDE